MPLLRLEANHKAIRNYYRGLKNLSLLDVTHEGAVRTAFQELLGECARKVGWNLITEHPLARGKRPPLRVDGAIVDNWNIPRGYWEAKDEQDDLKEEVKKKIAIGYPTNNILFQAPNRAILYQHGRQVLDESLETPDKLIEVLREFFRYQEPEHDQWELAAEEFKTRVPELAKAMLERIELERKASPRFVKAFGELLEVCRRSINPNLSEEAVEEMLLQHLLTERIFRKVFDSSDFVRRNPIAAEIEKVIDALTSRVFNRDQFLSELDRFYRAIENTAATIKDFSEKQRFLNTVYEKFFQGFSVKIADTHGIVYTPQPIVRFMVRSVDEILKKEFGQSHGLGNKGVHVIDPFVGTGNFILHVMQQIPRSLLAHKYDSELHANEVMLLPYYIASLNIEHEYSARMDEYKPFEGLCLVDTFELAEDEHPALFTEKNTERVEKQRRSPIFVVIGNPPYNAWQTDENDNNKNRTYPTLERRVTSTYAAASSARLLNSTRDPYIKAIRWATDRIGREGIVAFVSNNSFVEGYALDGVRKHLEQDFDAVYILDLGGNIRQNPRLSGTTHNVFGIQVGVSISFFVRKPNPENKMRHASVYYAATNSDWRKEEKYKFLDESATFSGVEWTEVVPDVAHTWIHTGLHAAYSGFLPLGPKAALKPIDDGYVFGMGSNGILSGRDSVAYNFSRDDLERNVRRFLEDYAAELDRYTRAKRPADVDKFLVKSKLKWSRNLKRSFEREREFDFDDRHVRIGSYRPFTNMLFYFAEGIVDEEGQLRRVFPNAASERENLCICCAGVGNRMAFGCLALRSLPARDYAFEKAVVFSFYRYDQDGSNGQENITDWALGAFRDRSADKTIQKWDVFYYVYALLHHPAYRHKYKANLKRELPRVPLAPDFWALAKAGRLLAKIHVDYEAEHEHALELIENPKAKHSWRVERMRLSKDKTRIVYNDSFTLAGIPPEVFEYRLGNRSALEWVIEQYQVSIDKRSGITNDPNRPDDPPYIVRLIEQVVRISLETVRIVRGLPPCEEGGLSAAEALASIAAEAEAEDDEPIPEEATEELEPPPRRARKPATPVAATRESQAKASTAPSKVSGSMKKTDKALTKKRS